MSVLKKDVPVSLGYYKNLLRKLEFKELPGHSGLMQQVITTNEKGYSTRSKKLLTQNKMLKSINAKVMSEFESRPFTT